MTRCNHGLIEARFEHLRGQAVFTCGFAVFETSDDGFNFRNGWYIKVAVVWWRVPVARGGLCRDWRSVVVQQFEEVLPPS